MDHQGHRERLKQRFRQEGLDGFGDEKVLELLLFYIIPRRDTAPIARALLEQFGSLTGVLEASPMALTKVPGMGENAASFIQFIMALNRYYLIRQTAGRKKLTTLELCREYLWPRFLGLQEERVCALCLDAGCGVLGCKILGSGSVNSAAIPIRKIVENLASVVPAGDNYFKQCHLAGSGTQSSRRYRRSVAGGPGFHPKGGGGPGRGGGHSGRSSDYRR